MSARDTLLNALWDNYTRAQKNAFVDTYRDEVALEIGRDALRDGLAPALIRLVGEVNAEKLMDRLAIGEGVRASARDDLISGLKEHACCFSEEDATRMIDAFAHELAEQIRDEAHRRARIGERALSIYALDLADLIDPLKDAP